MKKDKEEKFNMVDNQINYYFKDNKLYIEIKCDQTVHTFIIFEKVYRKLYNAV